MVPSLTTTCPCFVCSSFAVAAAVVGLINQSYFENVFASLAGALKGPIDYVASLAAKLPAILVSLAPEGLHIERGVIDTLVLLITSVMAVPLVCKLPGGSPVLGFLAGGAFIGPFALGLIQEVHAVQYLVGFIAIPVMSALLWEDGEAVLPLLQSTSYKAILTK